MTAKSSSIALLGPVLALIAGCGAAEPRAAPPAAGDLQQEIADVLAAAEASSRVSLRDHTPWELVHAALGLGLDHRCAVRIDDEHVSLHEFFFDRSATPGSPYVVDAGRVRMKKNTLSNQFEAHPGQFAGYFAQLGVTLDTPLSIDGGLFTLADLVDSVKRDFRPGDDNTYVLMALSHYGSWDEEWRTSDGHTASVRTILLDVLNEPIDRLPCGGTHRLCSLATALRLGPPESSSDPLWTDVRSQLDREMERMRQSQQEDGSIDPSALDMDDSEHWISKVNSTGHVLEWVLTYSGARALDEPWVLAAATYLCEEIRTRRGERCPASPWYHALHALRMVDQGVPRQTPDVSGAL